MSGKQVVGALLASAFLVVSACSSDDGGGSGAGAGGNGSGGQTQGQGSSPGSTRTLADYCTPSYEAEMEWCSYHAKCCTEDDKRALEFYAVGCFNPATVQSVSSCVAEYEGILAKGEFGFDGRYVDACLKDLAPVTFRPPTSCSGTGVDEALAAARASEIKAASQSPACRSMFPGKKQKGDTCKYDSSCAFPLACRSIGDESICAEAGEENRSCGTRNAECSLGLSCVDGLCQSAQKSGGRCATDGNCDGGLVCQKSGSSGFCTKPLGVGASCKLGESACADDLWCDGTTCRTRAPVGASCTEQLCEGRCDSKTKKCVEICGG